MIENNVVLITGVSSGIAERQLNCWPNAEHACLER